ncbi:MAG: hypothetical protein RLY78_2513 [Pseudomonadota bacterium]
MHPPSPPLATPEARTWRTEVAMRPASAAAWTGALRRAPLLLALAWPLAGVAADGGVGAAGGATTGAGAGTGVRPGAAAPVGGRAPGRISDRIFGAWSLACPPGRAPCTLSQVVARDPSGRQVVLGASVVMAVADAKPGARPAPRPRLEFRMSAAAVREAGVGLKIGNGAEYRLPMGRCLPQACTAGGWLDDGLRRALAGAPAAQVAFLMPPRQQVTVPLALTGLTEGLQALAETAGARR